MKDNMGASQATGLAGAEAPEPPSRLGPSDGIPCAAQPLIDALRALADCDARSGEPLGSTMRTAAAVIERVSEVDHWEGGGDELLSWVCHGFYETGTRTVHNPHWKPLP
jgi:hypothetical protein